MSEQISWSVRLNQSIRFRLKKIGRNFLLRLGNFFGKQSQVSLEPVLDNEYFPFLEPFKENWKEILNEVNQILKYREEIPAFQEISPDQKRISKDKSWKTFFLYGFGIKFDRSCAHAPITASLLSQVPNLQSAWFSILAPGYHIPAHKGVSRGILRTHLGLIVPAEQKKCRLRVKDEIVSWQPGEIFVFDDTYDHEVWNDTDEERVVLLFDFDRPMRFWGRVINRLLLSILKRTAFFKIPKNNLEAFERRFTPNQSED